MKRLNFLLFLCSCITLRANDSLIRYSDLNFKNSVQERGFYRHHKKNSVDPLDLLLTAHDRKESHSVNEVRQLLNRFANDLVRQIEGKSESKKVSIVFKAVHDRFLSKYQLKNNFSDIFYSKGLYNCVSGTAIFAVVFDQLGIPYTIKESPQHVFLVAYPETKKILVESTRPQKGYYQFSEQVIHKYLNFLTTSKFVSEDEVKNHSAEELFEKYFFASSKLDLVDLAGIQYSNFGIYLEQDEKYEAAVEEFKRAYYLNPCHRHRMLLGSALQQLLLSKEYTRKDQLTNLVLYCKLMNKFNHSYSSEFIYHEYARMLNHLANEKSDYHEYNRYYYTLRSAVGDSFTLNKISFTHHQTMALTGVNGLNKQLTYFAHLDTAYQINPNHHDLRKLIIRAFEQNTAGHHDTRHLEKQIDDYRKHFPFLDSLKFFNRTRGNLMMEKAYQFFVTSRAGEGEQQLAEFEEAVKSKKDFNASENFVEKAYSTAAAYYFKKGQKEKCRSVLKRGISHAPDNFALYLRLNKLNN